VLLELLTLWMAKKPMTNLLVTKIALVQLNLVASPDKRRECEGIPDNQQP